jgi:hypothetical protein
MKLQRKHVRWLPLLAMGALVALSCGDCRAGCKPGPFSCANECDSCIARCKEDPGGSEELCRFGACSGVCREQDKQ